MYVKPWELATLNLIKMTTTNETEFFVPLAPASHWLKRYIHLIPDGEVLDLASGAGRNCPAILANGNQVLALDRDPVL